MHILYTADLLRVPKFRRDRIQCSQSFPKRTRIFRIKLARFNWLRAALFLLVAWLVFAVATQALRDTLIIDIVNVPAAFETQGITSQTVARRIADTLNQIQAATTTRIARDNPAVLTDTKVALDIEIPGTRIGLRTAIETVLDAVGKSPTLVAVDIFGSPPSAPANLSVVVVVHLTRTHQKTDSSKFVGNTSDIDGLAHHAAELILRGSNPYLLAVYYAQHRRTQEALDLLPQMIDIPGTVQHQAEQALLLWGTILATDARRLEATGKHDLATAGYLEAIAKYDEASKLNPSDPGVWNNWGVALSEQGQFDEAVRMYKKAIAFNPKVAFIYNSWATTLAEEGQYKGAEQMYQRASAADPHSAYAYLNWGNMLADQRMYTQAIAKYKTAIAADPKVALGYFLMAEVFGEIGDHTSAVALYQTATHTDPDSSAAYAAWGQELVVLRRYGEACEKFKEAAELGLPSEFSNLDEAGFYDAWGYALTRERRLEEAAQKFWVALARAPNQPELHNNLGHVFQLQQQYDLALLEFREAIAERREYSLAYHNEAEALTAQGKYKEAETLWQRATDVDQGDVYAHEHWCALLVQEGAFARALDRCYGAVKIAGSAIAYHSYGKALAAHGRYSEAVAAYLEALKRDSGAASVYSDLGGAYQRLKRSADADVSLAKAREISYLTSKATR